jgi:putative protease
MQLVTFVQSLNDIQECQQASLVRDVLVEPRDISRLGCLSLAQACELAKHAREAGLRPILVWDVLMTEWVYKRVIGKLEQVPFESFHAIRVADLGAANWVCENTTRPIHLMVEAGSHNTRALDGWLRHFGDRLERLVVSHELPEASLAAMVDSLPVEFEILGAGRIELFYSPRPLLSKNFEFDQDMKIEVTSASENSHNRQFPTIETAHGTMMFLDRDRFVLNRWKILEKLGISATRVDLRHLSPKGHSCVGLAALSRSLEIGEEILWPVPSGAPFKHSNNTTRQFNRLRPRLALERGDCVAQVIACESERFTVFRAFRRCSLDSRLRVAIPTGEELFLGSMKFQDVQRRPIESCENDQVFVSPWIRKAGPGSLLFLDSVE